MVGSFKFNGVESESFSLVCKTVKRPLLPASKTNIMQPLGASGGYDNLNNNYDVRTITMHIAYIGTSFAELRSRARSISAWLSTRSFEELIINDETDKYYLAKVVDEIDLDSFYESGGADITFVCQPFAYSVTENAETYDSGDLPNLVFNNVGTRDINNMAPPGSKFLITIVGSWTVLSLELNGFVLTHTAAVVKKTLVIDNVEMTAYLDAINAFDDLSGNIDDFLNIIPGENTLVVTGTGLNITSITVNFIKLWI